MFRERWNAVVLMQDLRELASHGLRVEIVEVTDLGKSSG